MKHHHIKIRESNESNFVRGNNKINEKCPFSLSHQRLSLAQAQAEDKKLNLGCFSLLHSPGNSQNCLYGDVIKMASLLESRCYGPFSSVAF